MKFVPTDGDQAPIVHFNGAFDWFVSGDRPSTLTLMGYALFAGRPVRAVRLYSEGVLLAEAAANLPRPDAAERHGLTEAMAACGFHVRISKFLYRPGADAALMVVADTPEGPAQELLAGRIEELPGFTVAAGRTSAVNPLMIFSLGRSGSTLLMALLSRHPQIAVLGSYPFEVRPLAWMLQTLRVRLSPADHAGSLHPDSFETKHPLTVGANPYWMYNVQRQNLGEEFTDWLETTHVQKAIEAARESLDDLAQRIGGGRDVRFYAEKFLFSGLRPLTFNAFPGAREIFLVRDFRDTFASARRFNRKRNTQSFGRETAADDEQWIRGFGYSVRVLLDSWRARDGLLVRYEDLVADPAAKCAEMCRALQLDSSPALVRQMVEDVSRLNLTNAGEHMTSSSAGSSVGSWESELSGDEQRLLLEEVGEALEAFGYVV